MTPEDHGMCLAACGCFVKLMSALLLNSLVIRGVWIGERKVPGSSYIIQLTEEMPRCIDGTINSAKLFIVPEQ